MINKLILLIFFSLSLLLFLLFYFYDIPDSSGVVFAFLAMFIFPATLTLAFNSIPFIRQALFNREYYKMMGWDAETIAEYESDLKLHDEQVKQWTNTK